APHQAPSQDLHRQGRRRALADRGQDRRPAGDDPAAQPARRRAVAARRPEDQARALRPLHSLLATACAAAALGASAASAAAAPPAITAPEAILVEPQTQDV